MIDLAADTKFAAIHLSDCSSRGLPASVSLDNELSAHTAPIMMLDDLDKIRRCCR